jgi:hypothetical protein
MWRDIEVVESAWRDIEVVESAWRDIEVVERRAGGSAQLRSWSTFRSALVVALDVPTRFGSRCRSPDALR